MMMMFMKSSFQCMLAGTSIVAFTARNNERDVLCLGGVGGGDLLKPEHHFKCLNIIKHELFICCPLKICLC